ncbi:IE-1 [Adoxophyes orana nucleopolyhedrovirus]|uniref:IE-1 n=1 Tax=Adoxophyes orana nucleopolyhedrovirus TaxID=542343 RepID=UPI0001829BE3|nr:IE-1 [Adoxophyes orana nucleopolyhedrovirus]ACF05310.1 IE-1 [Adoxophyes orana nucleopolyhedrovirus]
MKTHFRFLFQFQITIAGHDSSPLTNMESYIDNCRRTPAQNEFEKDIDKLMSCVERYQSYPMESNLGDNDNLPEILFDTEESIIVPSSKKRKLTVVGDKNLNVQWHQDVNDESAVNEESTEGNSQKKIKYYEMEIVPVESINQPPQQEQQQQQPHYSGKNLHFYKKNVQENDDANNDNNDDNDEDNDEEDDDEDGAENIDYNLKKNRYKELSKTRKFNVNRCGQKLRKQILKVNKTNKLSNAYVSPIDEVIKDTTNDLSEKLNDYSLPIEKRRFIHYMKSNRYYMFVVYYDERAQNNFCIMYANSVNRIASEYQCRYKSIDDYVMVLSISNHRFLISYDLIKKKNIYIPKSDDFTAAQLKDKSGQVKFSEIKNFEFMADLINAFHLDMCYGQTTMTLLMASLGETRSQLLGDRIATLSKSSLLYILPLNFNVPEHEGVKDNADDTCLYVKDILNYSHNKSFYVESKKSRLTKNEIIAKIQPWIQQKKKGDTYFTYKYGSIARLLYKNLSGDLNKMLKIKKEHGGKWLIDIYLNASGAVAETSNFILINVKNDERITIIKRETKYYWISTVSLDDVEIQIDDIINTFKKYNHYVFKINSCSRKELNNYHNCMIKLVKWHLDKTLSFDDLVELATDYLQVCHFVKKFD